MRIFPDAYNTQKAAFARPELLCIITTVKTRYIYGITYPSDSEVSTFDSLAFWNGTDASAGDGGFFGAIPATDIDARLLELGDITETLAPRTNDLIASLVETERGGMSVTLDNTDGHFSELLGDNRFEPFLGQNLKIWQAFQGNSGSDFVELFSGEISAIDLTTERMTVTVESTATLLPSVSAGAVLLAYGLASTKLADNTVILLHSNTTDGSTTFTDSGENSFTVSTYTGTPSHRTIYKKFGTSSIRMAAGDIFEFIGSSDLSQTPITIEFFIYIAASLPASRVNVFTWPSDTILIDSGVIKMQSWGLSQWFSSGYDLNAHIGEWVHVAYTKDLVSGTPTRKWYINGVNTATNHGSIDHGPAFDVEFLNDSAASTFYIDEFRLSSVIRDAADFPPTAQYPGYPLPILAQSTVTHAQAAPFFASDTWACAVNFRKTALGQAFALLQLENQTAGDVTLEIGIDASNHPYCITGQAIETIPTTTTFTSSQTLTADAITKPINLKILYSVAAGTITFTLNGIADVQAAAAPFDRTGTANEKITIGKDFDGVFLNLNFNDRYWGMNAERDGTLVSLPDVIGSLDLPVLNGAWEAWT
jgi:hypothetical protein